MPTDPTWDDTTPIDQEPAWEDTTPVDSAEPAWEDTVPLWEDTEPAQPERTSPAPIGMKSLPATPAKVPEVEFESALKLTQRYLMARELTPDPAKREWLDRDLLREFKATGNEGLGREILTELGNLLGKGMTPLLEIAKPVTEQDAERLFPGSKVAQVAAGVQRGVAGAVNTMTSPIGIATLGQGALPKTAQRVISSIFATDMARHTPELARQAGESSVTGTAGQTAEALTGLAVNTGFAGLAGGHALAPGKARPGSVESEIEAFSERVKSGEIAEPVRIDALDPATVSEAGEAALRPPEPPKVDALDPVTVAAERAEIAGAPTTAVVLREVLAETPKAPEPPRVDALDPVTVESKPEPVAPDPDQAVIDSVKAGEVEINDLAPRLRSRVRAAMEKSSGAEDALSALKIDTEGKVFDAVQGIPVAAWNGSIDAVRAAIKSGRVAVEAVDEGLKWLKENHPDLKFEEMEYRRVLEAAMPKPVTQQAPTQNERKGTTALQKLADDPSFSQSHPVEATRIRERQYIAQTEKGRNAMADAYLNAYRDKAGKLDIESTLRDLREPDLMSGFDSSLQMVTLSRVADDAMRRSLEAKNPIEARRLSDLSTEAVTRITDMASKAGQDLQTVQQSTSNLSGGRLSILKAEEQTTKAQVEKIKKHIPKPEADGVVEAIKKAMDEAETPERKTAKEVKTEAQKIILRKLGEMGALPKVSEKGKAAIKEKLPELVELANAGALNYEAFYNVIAEKFGLPSFTPEIAREIMRLAEKVQRAPEGLARNKAADTLADYITAQLPINKAEFIKSWWYSSVLSGMNTQERNIFGNTSNLVNEFGAMAARQPDASPAMVGGMVRALIENVLGGEFKAIIQGDMSGRIGKGLGQGSHLFEVTKHWENPSLFKKSVIRLFSKGRYVTRFMVAVDSLFKDMNMESKAVFEAWRKAKGEGVIGRREIDAAIQKTLELTPEQRRSIIEQVDGEVTDGRVEPSDRNRRVLELSRQRRPKEIMDSAEKFGLEATLNQEPDPYTFLGGAYRGLISFRERFPVVTPIVPFLKIVMNHGNNLLNHSPIGLYRLMSRRPSEFRGGLPDERNYSVEEWQQLRAKVLISQTVAAGIMTALQIAGESDDPQFAMTGSGLNISPARRGQLRSQGWKPYSIKVGDKWIDYRVTPYALMFAVIGQHQDGMRYGNLSDKSLAMQLSAMVGAGYLTVIDQSALATLGDLLGRGNPQSVESLPDGALKLVSRTLGGLIPQAFKDLDTMVNPEVQKAVEWHDYFQRENPIGRWTINRPSINALGEVIERPRYPWRWLVSESNQDPVWQALAEKANKGVFLPVPAATAKLNGTKMTDEEFYEYAKRAGILYRKKLEADLDRFKAMPPEKAAEYLNGRVFDRLREIAKHPTKFAARLKTFEDAEIEKVHDDASKVSEKPLLSTEPTWEDTVPTEADLGFVPE